MDSPRFERVCRTSSSEAYLVIDGEEQLGCGAFAFRAPVPAYKHDAARFLALRGWIGHNGSHPDAPTRPDADDEVLAALLDRLEAELAR